MYPNDPCPCGSGKNIKNAAAESKIYEGKKIMIK